MSTAIVKRGARATGSADSYGWAVPNYTYAPPQYAPGPMPAPAWPKSDYSYEGPTYGNFLTESSDLMIPNWALLIGGGLLLWKLRDGRSVPVRSNPYGVPFLFPALLVGGSIFAVKSVGGISDWFSGMSGAGLFAGLALGALYGMKNQTKGAAMGGAIVGWGLGMAYEKSQQEDTSSGLVTKTWDFLV